MAAESDLALHDGSTRTRYVVVAYEGAADEPAEVLRGRSPLEVAPCPHATRFAATGVGGYLTLPHGAKCLQRHAIVGHLLGIDAQMVQTLRRGPVEARSLGLKLATGDVVYRGRLVTLDSSRLVDAHTAVSIEETRRLVDALEQAEIDTGVRLHVLGPGDLLVVFADHDAEPERGLHPRRARGQRPEEAWAARGAAPALSFMEEAWRVLREQELNEIRVELGENPANALWLWGGGRAVTSMMPFGGMDLQGALLGRGSLARGMAELAHLEPLALQDPFAMQEDRPAFDLSEVNAALRRLDFLMVYVGAPQELGSWGNAREKVRRLDAVDYHVLGPLLDVLESHRPWRMLLTSVGAVSSSRDEVLEGTLPFVMSGEGLRPSGCTRFDEVAVRGGGYRDVPLASVFRRLIG